MKTKSFLLNLGENSIAFGYSVQSKKWEFKANATTVLVSCKGQETAKKVANIILGAIKRTGGMDGLARANINRVMQEA